LLGKGSGPPFCLPLGRPGGERECPASVGPPHLGGCSGPTLMILICAWGWLMDLTGVALPAQLLDSTLGVSCLSSCLRPHNRLFWPIDRNDFMERRARSEPERRDGWNPVGGVCGTFLHARPSRERTGCPGSFLPHPTKHPTAKYTNAAPIPLSRLCKFNLVYASSMCLLYTCG
jgi:hypothetical protein